MIVRPAPQDRMGGLPITATANRMDEFRLNLSIVCHLVLDSVAVRHASKLQDRMGGLGG